MKSLFFRCLESGQEKGFKVLKVPGASGRVYKSASECKTSVSDKRSRVDGVIVSEGSTTFVVCEVPIFGDILR